MNILSLFDGISCGQVALKRAGIKYNNYYASEIDKYAIKITQHRFPNTVQLGDVCKVDGKKIPNVNLLLGGSPCQGFSRCGSRFNFDDPRSKLFFEYVRILKECKPKWFLLENVRMKQECQNIISKHLGVQPIIINSSFVSAQNRVRLYWTNIPNIKQPKDRKIYLKDIIESGFVDRDKSYCIDANYYKGSNLKGYITKHRRQLVFIQNKPIRIGAINKGGQGERVYSLQGKSTCLSAYGGGWGAKTGLYQFKDNIRKLTPLECERLQTLPDEYTKVNGISNTQRYKTLGNGWTVDVIVHILKLINGE